MPFQPGNKLAFEHGLSRTPEYWAWKRARARCTTPSYPHYPNYGGRGIRMCERWLNSFPAFLEDVGKRPTAAHSLDRINTNGDYEPGNCRWATATMQQRNKRNNRLVSYRGKKMPLVEAAEIAGIPKNRVHMRLKYGWTEEEALSIVKRRKNQHA